MREVVKTEDGQYITVPDGDPATEDEIIEYQLRGRFKKYRIRVVQRIGPFGHDQFGNFYRIAHEAIERLKESWYQSPHWDHEPTQEDKEAEEEYLREAEEAAEAVEENAAQLFYMLTGKEPLVEK